MAGSTLILPHEDGGRWFATAAESCEKGELEAAKAAAEANIPAIAIVGYLPALGASLAAADAVKSIASGADGPGSILRTPEAKGKTSFVKRLDPQVSPTLFALGELACLCKAGDPKALAEWNALAQAAPLPVQQAMGEVLATLKAPATSLGGKIGELPGKIRDAFMGLWNKIRARFGGASSAQAIPPKDVKLLTAISSSRT